MHKRIDMKTLNMNIYLQGFIIQRLKNDWKIYARKVLLICKKELG